MDFEKKWISLILFTIVASSLSAAKLDISREFQKLTNSRYKPTISDYEIMMGFGDESEEEIRYSICEERKWPLPYKKTNGQCAKYIRDAWSNKVREPSLYLEWLRSKLPKDKNLKIEKITLVRTKNKNGMKNAPFELVEGICGSAIIQIEIYVTPDLKDLLGHMHITRIDGRLIRDSFKKNLDAKIINSKYE